MVEPGLLCNQHLLGEHVELHMLRGSLAKSATGVKGLISNGLVDVLQVEARHQCIAEEMARRGMNHQSPLTGTVVPGALAALQARHRIIPEVNVTELSRRCPHCRERIDAYLQVVTSVAAPPNPSD